MNEREINLDTLFNDAMNFTHDMLNDNRIKENPAMVVAITELLKVIKA